jgi:hypothetical protein
MQKLTHDMLCQALEEPNSVEIIKGYLSNYQFDLRVLQSLGANDETEEMSFLNYLLRLNLHNVEIEDVITIIELFLEKEMDLLEPIASDINFTGTTTLELVIRYGDLKLFQYFVENTQ